MLEQVKRVALEAGARILAYYDGEVRVEYKEDESPLTLADRAAHDRIVAGLTEAFPEIPIISEEGRVPPYEERREFERYWLVDPLDGTKEFIKKNGDFTVNIALIQAGAPVLGVVYVPVLDKLFTAERGKGAQLQRAGGPAKTLRAKTGFDPADLTVSVSRSHPSGKLDAFLKTLPGANLKGVGSSLKFCSVAEGEVDFYPRFGPLNEWDTAAAHLVAEEGGGVIRGLDGRPLTYNKPEIKHYGFIAASSQPLLDYLFDKLAAAE